MPSSLILKGRNEIEITTKNINVRGLLLNKPLDKVNKDQFLVRKLGSVYIGYSAVNVGAYEMKRSGNGVARG